MTVRSADALRSIGALLRARIASHSAHPFTRSFPHGPPFHTRDGICSHGPPRPWIVAAGVLGQRAPASAIRTAVGLHDARVPGVCDVGGLPRTERALDRLLARGDRAAQARAERSLERAAHDRSRETRLPRSAQLRSLPAQSDRRARGEPLPRRADGDNPARWRAAGCAEHDRENGGRQCGRLRRYSRPVAGRAGLGQPDDRAAAARPGSRNHTAPDHVSRRAVAGAGPAGRRSPRQSVSDSLQARSHRRARRRASGFKGTSAEFVQFLRTDPRFYWTTPDDLMHASRELMKRIDPELTRLFGTLPRLPYGVSPIPSYSERSQTTAYYQPGSPLSHRAGTYFVNTYNLPARPKWEMEALSLHDAVPGHHLQIALAQELEGVPEFRRFGGYTAFVEGGGLYSESLGEELGLFTDPYSKFGQLTYEMWRAIRLVIDTGIHTMGWSRQQAIDYFKANAAKTEHDITVEVDRYIVWPGQALAYKIGELKIKELRAYAATTLGSRFDVRAFHDQVLGAGAVPLDVLDARIHAWVVSLQGGAR